MSCRGCGRPAVDWCAGCRTISRLKALWCGLQSPDEGLGLSLLRECAGALTDVAEARAGGSLPGVAGSSRTPDLKTPEKGASRDRSRHRRRRHREDHKEEKKEERSSRGHKSEPRKEESAIAPRTLEKDSPAVSPAPKTNPKSEPAKTEISPQEVEEESEEEEPRVVDPEVDKTSDKAERKSEPAKRGRDPPVSPPKPLGLTPIGAQLSAPSPEAYIPPASEGPSHRSRAEFRGSEREELPRRRSHQRDGERRPRSPSQPPARATGRRRERSKSRKKQKSKGKKKRQRAKEYWKNRDQQQRSWRQKQRPG